MKVLFIGGTGLISSACAEAALGRGIELTMLNRCASKKYPVPAGATLLIGDVQADEEHVEGLLSGRRFDAVVDWVAFTPKDIERDIRLFRGRTEQFIFISSASAYQKPPGHYLVTEETPLKNPYWQYSRDKIACERMLMDAYRSGDFPLTIVRPSLTYGPSQIPLVMGSWNCPYTVVDRIRGGKEIIIPGDGTSLWTLTWNADFAKGLVGLLGLRESLGEAFHITSDEVLDWNRIYAELGRAMGIEPRIVHIPSDLLVAYSPGAEGSLLGDKVNSVVFDNSKIKRFVPGFACEVNWAEGVRRALAWHEADTGRQAIDIDLNRLWDTIIEAYGRAWPAVAAFTGSSKSDSAKGR